MLQTRLLCILDGFGLAPKTENNAVALAKMPNFRKMLQHNWWTTLSADGEKVGQEKGLVGNSEVGHMNIGGLQLVPQLSFQVTNSAATSYDLTVKANPEQIFDPKDVLKRNWKNTSRNKVVHLVGLFSTGTIHSDLRHWIGAVDAAGKAGAEKIILHIISDGRDSDRQSLLDTWKYFTSKFASRLENYKDRIFLGSVGGRFYVMDRDQNWERTMFGLMFALPKHLYNNDVENRAFYTNFLSKYNEKSLGNFKKLISENIDLRASILKTDLLKESREENMDSLSEKLSTSFEDISSTIEYHSRKLYYINDIFDEYLPPTVFNFVEAKDTVWLLNFRTDRMKQLTKMLCDLNNYFDLNLFILSNNDYGIEQEYASDFDFSEPEFNYGGYYPVFKNKPVQNTLSQAISNMHKTQLHIAETEKYNHVTFFLNGGQDKRAEGEDWVIIDSNKVNSHAEKPAMKAIEITDYIVDNCLGKYDYVIVNYANPDMVGHTGDINASIESMEVLDKQLGRLVTEIDRGNHKMLLTADHGNVEKVGEYVDHDKHLIDTEHNPNPVPFVIIDPNFSRFQVIQNVHKSAKELGLDIDLEKVEKVLNKDNGLNLTDQKKWLESEQIPMPQLELWYAGVFLLCL
ncbi:MAG: hypothetical protein AAGF07_03175 [Patescibacteria group bacterium]